MGRSGGPRRRSDKSSLFRRDGWDMGAYCNVKSVSITVRRFTELLIAVYCSKRSKRSWALRLINERRNWEVLLPSLAAQFLDYKQSARYPEVNPYHDGEANGAAEAYVTVISWNCTYINHSNMRHSYANSTSQSMRRTLLSHSTA